jgi:sugar lactone lactonase YvrE
MSSKFQRWTVTEPYLDAHCLLGEGPYYEPATNTLRFVDIKRKQLHTVDLTAGPTSLKTLQLDMPVGVTADIEGVDPSEKILVGGKSGIYVLERKTGKYKLLQRFYDTEEKDERLRSNDGAVDPHGRFWIATMNDFWVGPPQAEGEFMLESKSSYLFTQKDSKHIVSPQSFQEVQKPQSGGGSRTMKPLYITSIS